MGLLCLGVTMGAERPPKTTAEVIPDVTTLLSLRGKPLVNEPFTTDTWSTTLKTYKADIRLGDGSLRIAPQEGAGHGPQLNYYARVTDVIMQVRFRFDGGTWMNLQVADNATKDNQASVSVDLQRITLSSITGWGPTTKVTKVASVAAPADPMAWRLLMVEWCGEECLVQVDGHVVLHGTSPRFALPKGQLTCSSSGGGVLYDDLRIWEAKPDPTWGKRQAEVLKTLPR